MIQVVDVDVIVSVGSSPPPGASPLGGAVGGEPEPVAVSVTVYVIVEVSWIVLVMIVVFSPLVDVKVRVLSYTDVEIPVFVIGAEVTLMFKPPEGRFRPLDPAH